MHRLLIALAVAFVATSSTALAKPKVAVAPVKGDTDGRVGEALREALSEKLTVVGDREGAAVVVTGKLAKSGKKKSLKLVVAVKGKEPSDFTVQFKTATSENFKNSVRDALLKRIGSLDDLEDEDKPKKRVASREDDEEKPGKRRLGESEDEEKEKEKEKPKRRVAEREDEEEKPKKRRLGESDGEEREKEKGKAKDKDKPKKRVAEREDEDSEDKDNAKEKPKKRVAEREDDEDRPQKRVRKGRRGDGESEGDGEGVREKPSPAFGAGRVNAGVSVGVRRLTYTVGAGAASPPPPEVGTGGGAARIEVEVYPFALSGQKGGAAGLGFAADYDKTFGVAIDVPGAGVSAGINQSHFSVGARYRVAAGSSAIAFGLSYARRTYIADRSALQTPTALDCPDTDYSAIAPGASARVPLAPKAVLFADLEGLLILSTGAIQDTMNYGAAKVFGVDGAAGVDLALAKRFGLRLAAEYTQINLSFSGTGSMASARGVSGATDRSFGVAATLAALF